MAGTRVRKGIELIQVGEEWNASTGKVLIVLAPTPSHNTLRLASQSIREGLATWMDRWHSVV